MSTVTLQIDGRDVVVPAGTGLVEAAESIGVEIPVFCYEPRIGPPVGACRMCLVEIEGMPKLQAACAMGVRDGMVVSTVSDKAREAQEAVLEFLLVNHPLDCPVCDKGGECPLQDQAFRWGPGSSRFTEAKRVNDKPIPVSPLIALDRERCILCYRCTRFSAEVTEDLQLVPRQRGANSVIATFEGRAWEGQHAGNVIELCPVGALTSTQFRFRARPWEAPDHPSIATWDPVGTNIYNTVREGRVVRVQSRRNDDVDYGWIDDRTRFAYEAMNGAARVRTPWLRAANAAGAVEASTEVALEWLYERLAAPSRWVAPRQSDGDTPNDADAVAPTPELWVLSGTETLETAYAAQQLAERSGGRVVAMPGASAAAPTHGARIADIRDAKHVLVIGDTDLLDDAPALDLWVRTARKNGASVTVAGIGGTRLEHAGAHVEHVPAGGREAWVEDFCNRIAAASGGESAMTEPGVIIFRDGELSAASLERLASTFAFPRAGSGFLAIPAAPNARGLAAMGIETMSWDELFAHDGGVVWMGIDPARHVEDARWKQGIERAAWTAFVDTLPSAAHAHADLVLPGVAGAEQDGTLVNMEGRLQRLTVGAAPADGIRTPLTWIAGLARRLGSRLPGSAASVYRRMVDAAPAGRFPVTTHGDITQHGVLGVSGGVAPAQLPAVTAPTPADGELVLYVSPFLYDAREVEHTPAMNFLRDETKVVVNRMDARSRGLLNGDRVQLRAGVTTVEATIVTSSRLAPGHARVHAGTPGFPAGRTGWFAASITALAQTAPAPANSVEAEV